MVTEDAQQVAVFRGLLHHQMMAHQFGHQIDNGSHFFQVFGLQVAATGSAESVGTRLQAMQRREHAPTSDGRNRLLAVVDRILRDQRYGGILLQRLAHQLGRKAFLTRALTVQNTLLGAQNFHEKQLLDARQ